MSTTPTVRSVLEQSLREAEGTAEEAETTDVTEDGTAVPPAEASTEGSADEESASQSEPAASGEADDDTPTEYYGVDLSGLPAAQRAEIIAHYQGQDKFIQQLLRNQAEAKAEEGEKTPDPGDEEVSDTDLLKALGLDDPDDPYAENTAKVALPLAKMVLGLQQEVQDLTTRTTVSETERYWETSLNALEAQFGKLPVSRDEVFAEAAKAGVAEPVDAYWRIMGPARQQVHAEVQKRRAELETSLKQGAKGARRPAADADTADVPIVATDVKDAMKQALAAIGKERGIRFTDDD